MWTKVLLAAAVVLLLSQNISAASKGEKKGTREYVNIENTTYYLETVTGFHRDEAKTLCESLNMTMVRFENEEKWNAVNTWIGESEHVGWFWTGALRDIDSTLWYWEETGEEIVDFYWAPGQPTLDDILVRSCIDFSYDVGGWDDDYCTAYLLNAMCQEIN